MTLTPVNKNPGSKVNYAHLGSGVVECGTLKFETRPLHESAQRSAHRPFLGSLSRKTFSTDKLSFEKSIGNFRKQLLFITVGPIDTF